jgi:hypothetical protein
MKNTPIDKWRQNVSMLPEDLVKQMFLDGNLCLEVKREQESEASVGWTK